MKPAQVVLAATLVASTWSHAGPLSMEPRLGLASDYSSNPILRADYPESEAHLAVLLDAPIRYDLEAWSFSLQPSVRYSDSSGYSSMASNYFHADAAARRTSERGSISLITSLARDSSLIYGGDANRGPGIRRDTRAGSFDWQHSPTERTAVQLGLNWSRVNYDQGDSFTNLTDYRYGSFAPSVGYSLTERDSVKLLGSAGRYNSLDGNTASKDYNVQLGFDRILSESWRLSASTGYSRSRNSRKNFLGPFFLGVTEYTQNSNVYNFSLKRTGEAMSFGLDVSRSLRPTGFAFLSRQDTADLTVGYHMSDRWSYLAHAIFAKSADPIFGGGAIERRYFAFNISADWHWTPTLSITLRASQVAQRFEEARFNGNSTGVSLELNRQFNRMDLSP